MNSTSDSNVEKAITTVSTVFDVPFEPSTSTAVENASPFDIDRASDASSHPPTPGITAPPVPKELGNNNNFRTRKEADIVLTQKNLIAVFVSSVTKKLNSFQKELKFLLVKQATWALLNNFEEWNKANERNSSNVVIPDDFYKCTDKTVINTFIHFGN